MRQCVLEGEAHGGEGLAAACGHGQAKDAGLLSCRFKTPHVHAMAYLVEFIATFAGKWILVPLKAMPQHIERGRDCADIRPFCVEVMFRVQEVSVHKCAEEHAQKELRAEFQACRRYACT